MLKFGMDMPLLLMSLYGGAMILAVLLVRALFKKWLPKAVMPVLWGLVLVRLLVPFSVSSAYGWEGPLPSMGGASSVSSYQDGELIDKTVELLPAGDYEQAGTVTEANASSDVFSNAVAALADRMGVLDIYLLGGGMALLYAAGVLAALGVLLARRHGYGKKLRGGLLIESNPAIDAVLAANGLKNVRVYTCDAVSSPLVCGVVRPRIYLPTRMDFADTALLRHVLTHECTHVKRGDNALKLVLLAALCLNWYNPLVWGMCRWLPADMESACDEATLRKLTPGDPDARKNYAASLLSMAVRGGKPGLLYSAFSKTEVERRIRGVLGYKQAGAAALAVSLLLFGGTVAFAASGQAPFDSTLCTWVTQPNNRWETSVDLTWNAPLGKKAPLRSKGVAMQVLYDNPRAGRIEIMNKTAAALAEEFGVDKTAFSVYATLKQDANDRKGEYTSLGLIRNAENRYFYQNEPVSLLIDRIGSTVFTDDRGTVRITVQRDDFGQITGIDTLHAGDPGYDGPIIW